MTQTSLLPAWFAEAIRALETNQPDSWTSIYAADAVHEFPFAVEGSVACLRGREGIGNFMRQMPAKVRFGKFFDIRAREVSDELIVEMKGRHFLVAGDIPFEVDYVWFITRRDGLVTSFRDYMKPLATAKAQS